MHVAVNCGESIKPRRRLSLTPRFRPKRAWREINCDLFFVFAVLFMQGNHHHHAALLFARFRCLSRTRPCVLIPLSRSGVCCLYTCCFLIRLDSICFLLFLSIHDTTLLSSVTMQHINHPCPVCIETCYCFWQVRTYKSES